MGTVRGIEHGYYKSVRPRVIRAIAGALGVQPGDVVEFWPSLGLNPANDLPPEGATGYAATRT